MVDSCGIHKAASSDFADPMKWHHEFNGNGRNEGDYKWRKLKEPLQCHGRHHDQEVVTNQLLRDHFVLSNCNALTMKRSSNIWRKSVQLYGLCHAQTMLAARCYFVALDAAKHGVKVDIPQ